MYLGNWTQKMAKLRVIYKLDSSVEQESNSNASDYRELCEYLGLSLILLKSSIFQDILRTWDRLNFQRNIFRISLTFCISVMTMMMLLTMFS